MRPIDYQQKMIEIPSEATITIRDPTNKSAEKQAFTFNAVYDAATTQETIFKSVCEPCIQKVIEGHNSCILG